MCESRGGSMAGMSGADDASAGGPSAVEDEAVLEPSETDVAAYVRGVRRVAFAAVIVGGAIGLVTLVGWLFNLSTLLLIDSRPNAALNLVLLAIAFFMLLWDEPESADRIDRRPRMARRVIGWICAAIVCAVAVVTLAEYALGRPLGIDAVLVGGREITPDFEKSVRIAFNGAIAFLLVATATMVYPTKVGRDWIGDVLAGTAGLIGAIALIGKATDTPQLAGFGFVPDAAVGPVIGWCLLSAGLLGVFPRHGVLRRAVFDTPGGRLIREVLPTVVLFPIVVVIAANLVVADENARLFVVLTAVLLFYIVLVFGAARVVDEVERQRQQGLRAGWRRESRANAERLQTLEQLDRFFNLSFDLLCVLDVGGSITRVNPAWGWVLGYLTSELPGRSFIDFVHPDDLRAAMAELTRAGAGEQRSVGFVARFRRRDGSYNWISWQIAVRPGEAMFASGHDITERKEAEEELVERGAEAARQFRMKSEYLATMSHEIRTPMNGVIGLTTLLLGTELDHTQRAYAEAIDTSGKALLSVITDVLDISKIEAGRMVLEQAEFSLLELVEDVADLEREGARAKRIGIGAYCEPTVPPRVVGDPARLRQLLLNLLSNAVKFTDVGGVSVTVRLADDSPVEGPVVRVLFEVSDTGIGIDPETVENLLASGPRIEPMVSPAAGVGLGLAISRRLTDAMNGQIGARSVPGRGSVFWCVLPLLRGSGAQNPEATSEFAGSRLLLVTGDEVVGSLLCRQLADWSVLCSSVSSADAALTMWASASRGERFAAAIVDTELPDGQGLALLTEFAARSPVIMLTRDLSPGMPPTPPAVAVLARPVRRDHLRDCVRIALDAGARAGPVDENGGVMGDESVKQAIRGRLDDLGAPDPHQSRTLLIGLVDTFLSHVPSHVDSVARAVESGDSEVVYREAHSVKGSAGTIGATELARRFEQLEELGRRHQLDEAPPVLDEARHELDVVTRVLADLRPQL